MGFKKDDENCESTESSSIIDLEASSSSLSTDIDLTDDASSSSSNFSPSSGPLYELSELIAQLPMKRGLSKYYDGKSQTFGSLASVRSIEDLAKKEKTSCSKRMKTCKSYGNNLNNNHHKFCPKATIAKKSPKRPLLPSLAAIKDTMVVN